MNPDTGTCFVVAGLLTYADAKQLNPSLDISAVANPNDVVYLIGHGNEAVLVQTDIADYVFTLANTTPSSQLYQVNSVTTVAGSPSLVTGVSLYPAGTDPTASGAVFTAYDPVFTFTPSSGSTGAPLPAVQPTATTGPVNLVFVGDSGGNGSNGYIFGGGGDGGDGAPGPAVTVVVRKSPAGSVNGAPFVFSDPISTTDDGVAGIRVASVGGDGGNGGSAYSLVGNGGDGGIGGAGGPVDVTNYSNVTTAGSSAPAMFVYSQSGQGGSAGDGGLIGGGGSGGASRDGGTVTVLNKSTGTLTTYGTGSFGIRAYSMGGSGGSGGSSFGLIGRAGSAAGSGSGGVVRVTNDGEIYTFGERAYGILAQSIGGSGGDGGNAGGIAAWSSDGAQGGNGSSVFVTNTGFIETRGQGAHGVVAQSIGGGGGSGGNAGGLVALAAAGGKAGHGGAVTVTNNAGGIIRTYGANANAILAQSIGGGGGTGGDSGGLVGLAYTGGGGGAGGSVSVTNAGTLQTLGSNSRGIKAQSIGGGGGDGGGAGGLVALAGEGGGASPGGAVTVTNSGDILTGLLGSSGRFSDAIFAQSVGGGGGEGGATGGLVALSESGGGAGNGGVVRVTNSGYLQTLFDDSFGIFAQSVGGGGGSGGGSGGLVALAGGGGGAAAGGAVTVSNALGGNINTSGARSGAIFAQSVGGGGGNGAPSGGLVAIGGRAANSGGGNGATVTVTNAANLTTHGTESRGIFAQSVGGGGGSGGASGGLVALSGNGGGAGNGGAVTVTNAGQILTGASGGSGKNSAAIYAQSVGGGGGEGNASGGLVALGSSGGGAGNGGAVTVTNSGLLQTVFNDSFGIFAESVGGGGGAGGASGGLVALSGDGGGAGVGGRVEVLNAYDAIRNADGGGNITTTGDRSTAIFAHSIGGGGGYGSAAGGLVALGGNSGAGNNGGAVIVRNDGALTTTGSDSRGIFAQSVGGGGGSGGASGGLVALSGDGGGSGNGGAVTVTNAGQILTGVSGGSGKGSTAIFAQSVGGGGGDSEAAGGLVAVSGGGGGAGNGGAVTVTNAGALQTWFDDSFGIFAQSVGGGGGAGGVGGGLVAVAGNGANAGDGGAVSVFNALDVANGRSAGGAITTWGARSTAILAQSIGGGGGDGQVAGGLVGVSGAGGGSGIGAAVTVTNDAALATHGALSRGIFAQSVGGGGGSGGAAGGLVAVSGDGGGGGNGGNVTVTNRGAISTYGEDTEKSRSTVDIGSLTKNGCLTDCVKEFNDLLSDGLISVSLAGGETYKVQGAGNGQVVVIIYSQQAASSAIFAQSIGGGGGTGSGAAGLVGVSGAGGGAADGGNVSVSNAGQLFTTGGRSYGLFAQSVGGGGGESAWAGGLFGIAGKGGGAGSGGAVTVDNLSGGNITTLGNDSVALFAQSVGGGGGSGDVGAGLGGVGGAGGRAASGGRVTVGNAGNLLTYGDRARGIFAQSVGGGGGSGGYGAGLGGLGGFAGAGADGGAVGVDSRGDITTFGRDATGIFAQSIGGGGGDGGDSAGVASIGGGFLLATGIGGAGGAVSVASRGFITTTGNGSRGIFAQSVGGGGGDGGSSYGVALAIGGDGGSGDDGGVVSVTNGGGIHTSGIYGIGIQAQSVGGGGGDGGAAYSGSLFAGVSIGGSGGAGGKGGVVDITLEPFSAGGQTNSSYILTEGARATGILAQSVGGGGGSGGKAIQATAGAFVSVSVAIGGKGGAGGDGGVVNLDGVGDVVTLGDAAPGVVLQSVGGGGGNGGSTVSVSLAAGEGFSVAGSVALGGDGGAGGKGGIVSSNVTSNIATQGAFSTGFLAQSVGGGGGNGGAAISAAASFSDGASAAVGVGLGGRGASGGVGGVVDVTLHGSVSTGQSQSDGIVLQSIGGGGGNAGTTIAASLGASGGIGANFSVGLGGNGGAGGNADSVTARLTADVGTQGDGSDGVIIQAVGGGGGNGGLTVGAGVGLAGGGAASVNVGIGGKGGTAGDGGIVDATFAGALQTRGNNSTGILAQSVGGGGGNSGGTIAAGLAGAGVGSGAINVAVGGDGGGGGDGGKDGVARAVTLVTSGSVGTDGVYSPGIVVQSIGGGGGNGGYVVSGGVAGAGTFSGTVGVALGGSGAGGGVGKDVFASIDSTVETLQDGSTGVLVQSVGGGGGNGGLSVAAGIAGSGVVSGNVAVGLGGDGGAGNVGGRVEATTLRSITTYGAQSHGFVAQSIGGGGGNGGGNVAANIAGAGTGAGGVDVGLGGDGGTGGHGGGVVAETDGNVTTFGTQSLGVLAQSVGGGGGNGNFNVAAGIAGAGVGSASIDVGLGGDGGSAGNGGTVSLRVRNNVYTFGAEGAGAIIAQSIGGGGGNGDLNVAASIAGAGTGTGGISVGIGGSGSGGGNGGDVSLDSAGRVGTAGNDSNGILAQSIGGGGGNAGTNVAGTISGAGVGNGSLTIGLGGDGALGGQGGAVAVTVSGPVETFGNSSRGIIAQSIGGGGGNSSVNVSGTLAGAGTGSGDITGSIGGSGGGGGTSGHVEARVAGDITTHGDFSDGLIAQTIGGGGGNSALTVGAAISGAGVGNGSAKVSLGGAGGAGGDANVVDAQYTGTILTEGDYSRGMLVQSIGGGGGNVGGNIAAGISGAGTGNGDLSLGVGGKGGAAGDGGRSDAALAVIAQASGQILTRGDFSGAFTAQSIGGGGGNGGFNVTASGSGAGTGAGALGIGMGGDGSGGGSGKGVDADIASNIWTYGNDSTGVLAQSVGGGGGNGGFNVTVVATGAGTGAGNASVGLGGNGALGGSAGTVHADATGTIYTLGNNSSGFVAQSIGGGGGNGGFNVTVSGSGAGEGSGAVAVGLGGKGDAGSAAGEVYASTAATVITQGNSSIGVLAQSVGGGGGNGGFVVDVSGSGAGQGSGSLAVGLGGDGAGGGAGSRVELRVSNDVLTIGRNSTAILAQSIGGGGGTGGFEVTVPLSGASTGSGVVGVGLGGNGGLGSAGGPVVLVGAGTVTTGVVADYLSAVPPRRSAGSVSGDFVSQWHEDASGNYSAGVVAQSIGGGGGTGGFDVTAALSAAKTGSGSLSMGLGGEGGGGGDGGTVDLTFTGTVRTAGFGAAGLLAQSVGGGGGNGSFSVSSALSFAGTGSGVGALSLGGQGGAGGAGGSVNAVHSGTVDTYGNSSAGVIAQSIGGGGGNGGFSVAGGISAAKSGSGALTLGLGGMGGSGNRADAVSNAQYGNVVTRGAYSSGVLAQSVGGGGGNGAFAVSGAISFSKSGSGALAIGLGGGGGDGGEGGSVANTVVGNVLTEGRGSAGVIAQSIGGGGGNGGFNVSGTIAIAKQGAGSLGVGIGGAGGTGAHSGSVSNAVTGYVQTGGDEAVGILTQSLGGGGGNGGFNVTGNLTAAKQDSGNLGIGIGGFGGSGGYAGSATSFVFGGVSTAGNGSIGILTQSLGGGGGNGAMNVTGMVNVSKSGSGATIGAGIGGFGGSGGDAGSVVSSVVLGGAYNRVTTQGVQSAGVVAQSIGGGGGNGGLNVTGAFNYSGDTGGNVALGLGGLGGGGGTGNNVSLSVTGLVVTQGSDSDGVVAQSIGGGGGNGGMNVAGSIALKSSAAGKEVGAVLGVGGFAGGGGSAGNVSVVHNGSIYAAMGIRTVTPAMTDPVTGAVITPAHDVISAPALAAGLYGSNGLVAQSIGGGGGIGGMNVSGSVSVAFGGFADAYGLVVGVGGFGGSGGDAGTVSVDVTGNEWIVAAGRGRSGLLAQSIGGGGGDGGTNISGSISTDASLLVGVGGFGGNGGVGRSVDVNAAVNINVLGSESDEQHASAGLMAQSIGGGGGNGGLNVSGGLIWSKETGVPAINVGVGGFGGSGAASGNVTVQQVGTITTTGTYTSGLVAQSIAGGGGNGATNIGGELIGADSQKSGGKSDVSIIAGVGGNAGTGADAGAVSVTQSGQIVTGGDYARGILAQSIGGGGGTGGLNVTAIIAKKSAPISVGVGGSGGSGGASGTVTVVRGDAAHDAGDIITGGAYAPGIEASSIGGGGGDAGMNFNVAYTSAGKTKADANSFAANFAIGGAGGTAADGNAVSVSNHSDIFTVGDGSHGILAQSIGGGGGNANFNMAVSYAGASTSPPGKVGTLLGSIKSKIPKILGGGAPTAYDPESTKNNQNLGFSLAVGGATGDGGDGSTVAVSHEGNISTYGDGAYGILAQSIGGGGGNAGLDIAFVKVDGGKAGISIGRKGGSGGVGGDVYLASDGEVRTFGDHAFGLLAQSIGNGGGNSSAITVGAEFPTKNADGSVMANTFGVSIGLEGGVGGRAGDVELHADGIVVTQGDNSHAIFAQSVGGGGGNGGSANVGGITAGTKFAMGGSGGEGGVGGDVFVSTSAQVETLGAKSIGVLAQSIGGGGGTGGRVTGGGVKAGPGGLDVLLGGEGGAGMAGGNVTVENSGLIITRNESSHGVLAQSIGGGGGEGGAAYDLIGKASTESTTRVTVAVGGEGGEGATGGDVTVTNTGGIGTSKTGSVGVFAQSIGGKGGNANAVVINTVTGDKGGNNLSVAIGGDGGSGGSGGAVSVNNLASAENPLGGIITLGANSPGIVAMSVGGGGGTGSTTSIVNRSPGNVNTVNELSVALGGSGGVGGTGGAVSVVNAQRIVTVGAESHGILAQSIGGGGGKGGMSIIGDASFGTAKTAAGALDGLTGEKGKSIDVALGGVGGDGNVGGDVSVRNSGLIDVGGEAAYGVYAQSVGGGGGDGAVAMTLSKDILQKTDLMANLTKFALGGAGGDGADAGNVNVEHTGSIIVRGADGVGIFAQSVGGGGGNSGISISSPVWTAAALLIDQVAGARDGTNGKGGTVSVDIRGPITVLGDHGRAYVSQSINGGGGKSSLFLDISQQAVSLGQDGYQLPDNRGDVDKAKAFVKGNLKLGATAVADAIGLPTVANFASDVVSFGKGVYGLTTQAVGGGGGLVDYLFHVPKSSGQTIDLNTALGATSASGSGGGAIDYRQEGKVVQVGDGSLGTVVQSVGGGGGIVTLNIAAVAQVPVLPPTPQALGATATGSAGPVNEGAVYQKAELLGDADPNQLTLAATLGAAGGGRNDGGAVTLSRSGAMETQGERSTAFVAQSIGGGGGQVSTAGLTGLSVTVGGSQGASGDGGAVSLLNVGTVTTLGTASNGVILQSIGGGGGLVLSDLPRSAISVATSNDNIGNGGSIVYRQDGTVDVQGADSSGIVLQSLGGGGGWVDGLFAGTAGGKGRGGSVDLTATGGVLALGKGGVPILVQSLGSLGGGDISIDTSGPVRGDAVGIALEGGSNNSITVRGSLSAISGKAITASDGNDTLTNHGLMIGNVLLGGGTNVLHNATDGTFVAMSTIDLRTERSAASRFLNDGDFQMGLQATKRPIDLAAGSIFATTDANPDWKRNLLFGTRVINTVELDGDFQQSAGGHFAFDIAYGQFASDRVNLTGSATVAGKGDIRLTWLQDHRDVLLFAAEGGGADKGLKIADTLAMDYSTSGDARGIHLSYVSDFGQSFLNRNGRSMGGHMDSALSVGNAFGVGRLMGWLGNLQRGDEPLYSRLFTELNPEPYLAPLVTQVEAATGFSQGIFSCTAGLLPAEGSCGRMRIASQDVSRDADFESFELRESGTQLAGWLEGPTAHGWSVSGSLQYDRIDRLATDVHRAAASGTGLHAGLGMRHQEGNGPQLAFSLAGGLQSMHGMRTSSLFEVGQGKARWDSQYLQADAGIGRLLSKGRWFARPTLTVSLTAIRQAAFKELGLDGNGVAGLNHVQSFASAAPGLDLGVILKDEGARQSSLVFSFSALYRSTDSITMPYRLLGTDVAAEPADISSALARKSYRMGVDLNLLSSEKFSLSLGYQRRVGGTMWAQDSHLSAQWRF